MRVPLWYEKGHRGCVIFIVHCCTLSSSGVLPQVTPFLGRNVCEVADAVIGGHCQLIRGLAPFGTGSVCCRSISVLHLSNFLYQEYLLEGEALLQHS
jgi:hypothetical protein